MLFLLSRDGSGWSGVFMVVYSQLEKLKVEGMVDVFQCVLSMRTQRPGIVEDVVRTFVNSRYSLIDVGLFLGLFCIETIWDLFPHPIRLLSILEKILQFPVFYWRIASYTEVVICFFIMRPIFWYTTCHIQFFCRALVCASIQLQSMTNSVFLFPWLLYIEIIVTYCWSFVHNLAINFVFIVILV